MLSELACGKQGHMSQVGGNIFGGGCGNGNWRCEVRLVRWSYGTGGRLRAEDSGNNILDKIDSLETGSH